jgi:mono/diheme cytochrome c family protein
MNKHFLSTALSFVLLMASACQQATQQQATETPAAQAASVELPNGKALFERYCVGCHGGDGTLAMNGAKDLTVSALSKEEAIGIITNGSENKAMMAYGNLLDEAQIVAIAEHVLSLRK